MSQTPLNNFLKVTHAGIVQGYPLHPLNSTFSEQNSNKLSSSTSQDSDFSSLIRLYSNRDSNQKEISLNSEPASSESNSTPARELNDNSFSRSNFIKAPQPVQGKFENQLINLLKSASSNEEFRVTQQKCMTWLSNNIKLNSDIDNVLSPNTSTSSEDIPKSTEFMSSGRLGYKELQEANRLLVQNLGIPRIYLNPECDIINKLCIEYIATSLVIKTKYDPYNTLSLCDQVFNYIHTHLNTIIEPISDARASLQRPVLLIGLITGQIKIKICENGTCGFIPLTSQTFISLEEFKIYLDYARRRRDFFSSMHLESCRHEISKIWELN